MNGNGYTIGFKYNDSGIRTSKTVNGVTTNYYLDGDKVICEDTNGIKTYYTHDSTGKLISMNYSGANYYYVRNAQGDIIALIDENGNRVANYTYDSWGKLISIKDQDGNVITNNTSSIGYVNPYRYRGYRYDSETGLYYLNSRYYNPEWGRFINADSIVGQTGDLLSHNMFAYCMNNPINNLDEDGYWKAPTWLKTVGVVVAAVAITAGIAALTVASCGTAGPVLLGAAIGFSGGFGGDVVTQYLTNGHDAGKIDYNHAVVSGAFGMVSGALGGSGEGLGGQILGNVALTEGRNYYDNPKMTMADFGVDAFVGTASSILSGPGAQNSKAYYKLPFEKQPWWYEPTRGMWFNRVTIKSTITGSVSGSLAGFIKNKIMGY